MKKKIVFIVIAVLICFLVGYVVFSNKNKVDNNEKNNNSSEILINDKIENNSTNGFVFDEEVIVDNLKFTNIKFNSTKIEEYEFLADVENLGDELIDAKNIDIKVLDENGEIISIFGSILKPLMSNEKGILKSYVLGDLTGAKKVEFHIVED